VYVLYIHVGEDMMVQISELIAIIDKKSFQNSELNHNYLQLAKKAIIDLAKGDFKSIVVTEHHVYLSPLSSNTLNKRSNFKKTKGFTTPF